MLINIYSAANIIENIAAQSIQYKAPHSVPGNLTGRSDFQAPSATQSSTAENKSINKKHFLSYPVSSTMLRLSSHTTLHKNVLYEPSTFS